MGIENIFENSDIKTKLDELKKNRNKILLLGIHDEEENFYICCELRKIVDNYEDSIIKVVLTENGIPYGRNTKARTYSLGDVFFSLFIAKNLIILFLF